MGFKFHFYPVANTVFEEHYVPFFDYDCVFYYQIMHEDTYVSSDYVQYVYFNPGQEAYPTNFLCKTITGDVYKKSAFISQGSDLWDQLQGSGSDSIPFAAWHFRLYLSCTGTYANTFTITFNVYKRALDTTETLLFSWTTPVLSRTGTPIVYDEVTVNQPEFDIDSTDVLVVKAYCDIITGEGAIRLYSGGDYPSYVEVADLSPSPISPSPSPDWVDEGNLLAPVMASVRLNTAKTMTSATGHEPKYLLDENPNTYFKPTSTADQTLYFDLGQAIQVDAFVFRLHNYNAGFGSLKAWRLSYLTDEGYISFDDKLFVDSRSAGVPVIASVFDDPVTARYWKFELLDFDEMPAGPIIEISGVWFMRNYSLPYDNQFPEPIRFEWGNDKLIARSGSSYHERQFRGHIKISDKQYIFVQQAHSDLLLNAYKASRGGLLPVAFKPDYDADDWILCRFISEHSLQETWSEVFQPRIEIKEVGFKRIAYTTKTLPMLSTTAGHWKFTSSLADSSGNDQTLVVTDVPAGATYDYGICDHRETCFVFNEDGLLNLAAGSATALDMEASDFSIELIFCTSTVSENAYILHKLSGNAGYFILISTDGDLDVYVGDAAGGVYGFNYGSSLDDGNFHYIVMTVNRTTDILRMYIDSIKTGVDLDIAAVTGNISPTAGAFQIGRINPSADPKCIIGLLDEVCISKQLLTQAQITSRYAGFSDDGSWRL